MCILCITDQQVTIKCESKRVYAEKEGKELCELQTRSIDAVVIMGNAQVTTQALALFASEGITVTYLCLSGNIKGQFLPIAQKNIDLRYLQYKAVEDEDLSFSVAKKLIINKIKAYIQFYRGVQKNYPLENAKQFINGLQNMALEAEQANTINELLGYEGMASRLHFGYYGKLFRCELKFHGRSYHPPQDEINAMLSFGYTMLFKLINGLLYARGLDPYLGFLHKRKYNRPSLACDLQELFRCRIVDQLALTLANKLMIQKKHISVYKNV